MQVQLAEVIVVSVSGIKAQFKVHPEDVVIADSMPFIKLKTSSWTLMSLIFEPARNSLTCCTGLSSMVQLRNDLSKGHIYVYVYAYVYTYIYSTLIHAHATNKQTYIHVYGQIDICAYVYICLCE